MTADGPLLEDITAAVYVIPTDAPEADGTLAAAPNLRHVEYFHDHQRIEQLLFDGALDPADGAPTPDPGRPGLGPRLRAADAERYRRA